MWLKATKVGAFCQISSSGDKGEVNLNLHNRKTHTSPFLIIIFNFFYMAQAAQSNVHVQKNTFIFDYKIHVC